MGQFGNIGGDGCDADCPMNVMDFFIDKYFHHVIIILSSY